jgi:hypothetical protein
MKYSLNKPGTKRNFIRKLAVYSMRGQGSASCPGQTSYPALENFNEIQQNQLTRDVRSKEMSSRTAVCLQETRRYKQNVLQYNTAVKCKNL